MLLYEDHAPGANYRTLSIAANPLRSAECDRLAGTDGLPWDAKETIISDIWYMMHERFGEGCEDFWVTGHRFAVALDRFGFTGLMEVLRSVNILLDTEGFISIGEMFFFMHVFHSMELDDAKGCFNMKELARRLARHEYYKVRSLDREGDFDYDYEIQGKGRYW